MAAAARVADPPCYPHGAGVDVDVSHAERGEFRRTLASVMAATVTVWKYGAM